MSVQNTLETKLSQAIQCEKLEIENESYQHAGHAHGDVDSHFKAVVISNDFEGVGKVARHQMIYKILADEINNPVHALVIMAYTPKEWEKLQNK